VVISFGNLTCLLEEIIMAHKEGERPVSDVIDTLEKAGQLTFKGTVFEDRPDAITIQVGASLFEIPKSFVLATKELEGAEGKKTVELTIASNARVVQKILTTAQTLVSRFPGVAADGGACACACNCNCACECACSSRPELAAWVEAAFRRSFGQGANLQW
jgi:hypothetical protein